MSLTEELHKARLKAITAARNLVELDALNPNHIIKHNGDISVGVAIEEFANLGVAAEVLLKEGCSKEQELTEKRTALSLEAFGDPNAYIKVKEEIRMDDKANSGNDLMTRLESFAKERMGVPYREFERVLRECDTSITVACLNQVLKLACDQWGFWEAEWLFSPAHSPNTLAKTEMEGWKALWRGSLDTLVETVPNVKDLLEQEQNLVVFGHSLRRAIEYNKQSLSERSQRLCYLSSLLFLIKLGYTALQTTSTHGDYILRGQSRGLDAEEKMRGQTFRCEKCLVSTRRTSRRSGLACC